ncbi:MAG: hypothetical protein HFJ84_03470 [Clostridiales bacterium]|jgi:hypothetical protein|nr:hypothetical protein [Clostridiales bacterium]
MEEAVTLRYYLFGNRKEGYGVEIIKVTEDGSILDSARQRVTHRIKEASEFARALAHGIVFPGSLEEIVPEWNFASSWTAKSNFF